MKRRHLVATPGLLLPLARTAPAEPPPTPAIERLEPHRYRIGDILIDRAQGRIDIPGSTIALDHPDTPLEFVAITRNGEKAYESLIELDATGTGLNLACILIGLDPERASDGRDGIYTPPLEGDGVAIQVRWQQDGAEITRSAGELLQVGGAHPAPDDWVYLGARLGHEGTPLADQIGVLIGFFHEGACIMQHRQGLGLGNYGAVTYHPPSLPAPGTSLELSIRRLAPG